MDEEMGRFNSISHQTVVLAELGRDQNRDSVRMHGHLHASIHCGGRRDDR